MGKTPKLKVKELLITTTCKSTRTTGKYIEGDTVQTRSENNEKSKPTNRKIISQQSREIYKTYGQETVYTKH